MVKRNEGNNTATLPYRVYSLCSSAPRRVALWMDGEARGRRHTERCLQVNGSHHDGITQLAIHQQQVESQELLPVAALAPTEPSGGEGLASHSFAAGLSQGHPHIAGYHTTTYQQLPTPQRLALHHAAQPYSTGWVTHVHSGVVDTAASCHFESRNCHVR